MVIERTSKEIIFKFPGNMPIDDLQDLADFFNFIEATQNFEVKQDDVDQLVKKVKKGRWNKTKSLLGE